MRASRCCCFDLKTGCFILLAVGLFLAVNILRETSVIRWIFFTIDVLFYVIGFVAVLKNIPKMLWPTIIWLLILTITVIILPMTGTMEYKNDVISTIFVQIFAVSLLSFTALVLWSYKQFLQEEERGP